MTRPPAPGELARLERYYDTVPRADARTEVVGPFTLFVGTGLWPYYARPQLGLDRTVTANDVTLVRERQRELGVPEALEWVVPTTPSLADAARAVGLAVTIVPLLVLTQAHQAVPPPGIRVRRVEADDPDLTRIRAVAPVAFAHGGTAPGPAGEAERDRHALADPDGTSRLRDRLREGLTVLVVADDETGPVATGAHQPAGEVTELVGIATLPAARRRGIGAAVTAALVDDAIERGLTTIFLSAASDEVARIYERTGFERIGQAGLAEAPGDGAHG
jgi:GNAT superfamily N-acetyltransferase